MLGLNEILIDYDFENGFNVLYVRKHKRNNCFANCMIRNILRNHFDDSNENRITIFERICSLLLKLMDSNDREI